VRSKPSRLQFKDPGDNTIVVGRAGAANVELSFATQGNRIKNSYLTHRLREFKLTEACLTFIERIRQFPTFRLSGGIGFAHAKRSKLRRGRMGSSGPGVWGVVIVSSRGQTTPILGGSQWDGHCRQFGFQTATGSASDNPVNQAQSPRKWMRRRGWIFRLLAFCAAKCKRAGNRKNE
jgi:hypothetical protein